MNEAAGSADVPDNQAERLEATHAQPAGEAGDTEAVDDVVWEQTEPALDVDRDAQQEADRQIRDRLKDTRSAAEKWGATAAAIFTALGFAALLGGRQALQQLPMGWEIGDGAAAVMALAVATVAVVWAALAAQGSPSGGAPTGAELRAFELTAAEKARSQLRKSRICLGVAIVLVIVAIGLLWYVPAKDSAYVLILPGSNTGICVMNDHPPTTPGTVIKVDECSAAGGP